MKKITLFAVLTTLLSWTGIIQAQTPNMPETSTSDNPKYYLIKSYRSNGYLTANPSGTATHEKEITESAFWYFDGTISDVTAGSQTIKQFVGKLGNKGVSGKFLTTIGTNGMAETGSDWYIRAHKYPTEPSSLGLAISIDANLSSNIDANNHDNGTGMYGGNSGDYEGTTWNIYSLQEAYQEALNDAKALLSNANANIGKYGWPDESACTALATTISDNSNASTDEQYVTAIENLQTASATFNAAPGKKVTNGYYRFKCKNGDVYLATNTFGKYESLERNILVKEANTTDLGLESIWELTYLDEAQNSFSLKNIATGQYINSSNSGIFDTPIYLSLNTPVNGLTFTYKYTIDQNTPAGMVAIRGNNYTMFFGGNNFASHYNGGIGSVWEVVPVTEDEINAKITTDAIAKLDQYFEEPGSRKIYSLNDFKPALATSEKANLEANKTYANYAAYVEAVNATASQIDENAYYYIISAYKTFNDGIDRYIYVDTDGSLKWKKSEIGGDISMLWKFTTYTDDYNLNGYNITSVNFKQNINTQGYNGTNTIKEDDNSITIEPSPIGNAMEGGVLLRHYISGDKHTLALRGSLTGNNHEFASPTLEDDNMGVTTANLDAANYATHFLLVRAESVNLNTTATADGNWSTTYLPIAVQLPAGATAYYVSAATNGVATLKENAENKIAAEEGVVIKSDEAGTIAATILTEEVSKQDNNLLKGSLTGVTVPDNAYVLAKENGIGFYKINPASNLLAGNKAYLEVPVSLSGVKAFTFDFGGTTGIDNPETAVEAEEYYDLQGRRVMNPTKGIYVTKSGKKVLFTK